MGETGAHGEQIHPLGSLRNLLSLTGIGLTTAAVAAFLILFLGDLLGLHTTNPYMGIVLFIVLPVFAVIGLLLIPVGAVFERRRIRRGQPASVWPRIDFNNPMQLRRAGLLAVLIVANIAIVTLGGYGGLEYMETPAFCGQVCDQAMQPEFIAHQSAPHASVPCVACHIGPGAGAKAESKLAGVKRVFAVAFGTYQQPIPLPAAELLPARDTCERCHWPEKFHGDQLRHIHEYADDEANTESVTNLLMHLGGGNERLGFAEGIHWHMNLANEIEFVATDDQRQVIPYVRMTDGNGVVTEYVTPGVTEEELANGERRVMDCMDCHNRPSHPIAATAARAVDVSLTRGETPKALPFVKREAVKLLEKSYPSQEVAMEEIAAALGDFYRREYTQLWDSRGKDVERAVEAVRAIYRRNVFPEMRVGFGTYPNNIGHTDFPGCFRCHDGEHVSSDGLTIVYDCETCHAFP